MLLTLHEEAVDEVAREEREIIDDFLDEAIGRVVDTSCAISEVVNPLFKGVLDAVVTAHAHKVEGEVSSIVLGSIEGALVEAERKEAERRRTEALVRAEAKLALQELCLMVEYELEGDVSASSGDLSSLPLSVGGDGSLSVSSGEMSSLAFTVSGIRVGGIWAQPGSISVSSGDLSSLAQTEGSGELVVANNEGDDDTLSVSSGEMSSLPRSPPVSPRPPPSPLLSFIKIRTPSEDSQGIEPIPSPLMSHKSASPFR